MCNCDGKIFNIVLCSLAFLFIFKSYELADHIHEAVKETYPAVRLALVFIVFVPSCILGPKLVRIAGPKLSMIAGCIPYLCYATCSFWPKVGWSIISHMFIGLGCALLWIGQGTFFVKQCDNVEISTTIGIFWALLHIDPIGNSYGFHVTPKFNVWSNTMRSIVLAEVAILVIIMIHCRKCSTECVAASPAEKSMKQLIKERNFRLMLPLFLSTGMASSLNNIHEMSFCNLVDNDAESIDVYRFIYEISNILVGFCLAHKISKKFRTKHILYIGVAVELFTIIVVFFNMPPYGHVDNREKPAIAPSSWVLALLCAPLFGVGNTCLNTQAFVLIYKIFYSSCPEVFGFFRLFNCFAILLFMVLSSILGLYILVGISIVILGLTYLSLQRLPENVISEEKILNVIMYS